MSREHRYVLNSNPGLDIVHVDPVEECNLDDAEAREDIEPARAAELVRTGQARYCEHCGLADAGSA